jgi:hypothetical protein
MKYLKLLRTRGQKQRLKLNRLLKELWKQLRLRQATDNISRKVET